MKTIGFVDYYISEWHANNYPGWIKEVCEKTGKEYAVKYVWAEQYVSPVDGRNTDQWCEDFGCNKCETIAELCEKCDYIFVLSPSNPEKHLEYAREVLKHKKNTYIDKTFTVDYEEAKEIFDIAKKNGTKFFSSSALRYADEIQNLENITNVITTGGGGNFEEYIIHQIEMAEKLLQDEPLSVKVENQGNQYMCNVKFANHKNATFVFAPAYAFTAYAEDNERTPVYRTIQSDFFKNMIDDILNFFETGDCSFDVTQTLYAMKIRTGIIQAKKQLGRWISL